MLLQLTQMKKQKSILITIAVSFIYLCISGYSTGLKDYTTNCSSCHGLASGKTFCTVQLIEKGTGITVTDGRYKANTEYLLSLNGYNKDSNSKFGFRIVITNKDTTNPGNLIRVDTAHTFIKNDGPIIIAGHSKINSSTIPGKFKATFEWVSPLKGSKSIQIQSIINSVNADNSSSGDFLSEEIIEKFEEEIDTKIMEKEQLNWSLFPNPANKTLYLNYPRNDSFSIIIYNVLGQQQFAAQNSREIDVSTLTNGLYLLRLTTKDQQKTISFINQ